MNDLLAFYAAPVDLFLHLPPWIASVLLGVQIAAKIGLGGWVLARTGRSPLWILLILVPYAEVVAVWVLAYCPWPAEALVRAKIEAGALPPPA